MYLATLYMYKLSTCNKYRILSSKHPWALEIDGQKTGVGTYTDKPAYIYHKRVGAYSREYFT